MEFVIISGISGAGKSRVAAFLEDMGFYCVDNMPVVLIPRFAEICLATGGKYEKVALVTDIRAGESFENLFGVLDELEEMGCLYKIVFVEASLNTIVSRYQETRRRHPMLAEGQSLQKTAEREKLMLEPVRNRADYIIDTTGLSLGGLKERVLELFAGNEAGALIVINVMSFGFKFGIPIEADLVFDVRFLPNPYYVNKLKKLTGLDEPVKTYLLSQKQTGEFTQRLYSLIDYLLPLYVEEGKTSLLIAIGCTGGRHRSVMITKGLFDHIKDKGYNAVENHRDMSRL